MTRLPPPRAIDIEILAMTLWAEAADKPVRAIEALAAMVMNRLKAGRDPDARHIAAICRAPSCFPAGTEGTRAMPRCAPSRPVMRPSRSVGALRNAQHLACCRTQPVVPRFGMMPRICPPGRWGKPASSKSAGFAFIGRRTSPRHRHAPRARCWFWLKRVRNYPTRTISRCVATEAPSFSRCQAPLIRISLGRKRAL